MMRDNTFELFGPLAANIREILFHESDPHSSNHNPMAPVASNADEAGRTKNHRVEMVLR